MKTITLITLLIITNITFIFAQSNETSIKQNHHVVNFDFIYEYTNDSIAIVYKGKIDWDSFTPVVGKGRFGYIDIDSNLIVPIVFDDVLPFNNGAAAVKKHNKWEIINKKGQCVSTNKYDYVKPFNEGYAIVFIGRVKNGIPKRGKYTFINTKGEKTTSLWYNNASSFIDGKALVVLKKETYYINYSGNRIK